MLIDLFFVAGVVSMVFGMWFEGLLLVALAYGAYLLTR